MSYQTYIQSVLTGTRNAGTLEKQAVQRFLDLQQHPDIYFDAGEVEYVTGIISKFRHTSGHYYKKQFELLPWQHFTIAHIFGLKSKATGARITRKAYIEISKKNGKSEFAGALGLYGAFFDEEAGAECYSAANKYDQAAICWGAGSIMAKLMSNEYPQFAKYCKIYDSINTRQIRNTATESFFKPLAADSKTLDGLRPHFAIIDEFHEATDDSVLKNLETAMVNRRQPLLMIITTAGFNIQGACYQYRKVIADILAGRSQDDSVFGLVFSPDEDDDWNDPTSWEKANPSLGQTPTLEGLQTMYRNAVNEGSTSEVNFKTKNLNIWVRQSRTWIPDAAWMAGQQPIDTSVLAGRKCFAAFDLSANRDLTAFGMLFPPIDGAPDGSMDSKFQFVCKYYIPADNTDQRVKRDRVPYHDWHKKGLVTYTDGNVIDYDYIKADVNKAAQVYDIQSISYDQWQSIKIAVELQEEGVTMSEFRQTVTKFNEPIRMIENLIAMQQLMHGGDEVLRWMAGNVAIKNANGLVKFDKDKSREKIDGMVVLAMCMGGYLQWLKENEDSVYNSYELRVM
jgi:phage terminase large subunit-like protein